MATLRLASPFTHHAVLQRQQPLPVWGWAASGERIVATLAGQRREVDADDTGAFRLDFAPLPGGGPHELTISGRSSGSITLHDLLVGEVWLCSGQSNMEWPASISGFASADLTREIPNLRLFQVPRTVSAQPNTTVDTGWTRSTLECLAQTTGVGLAFARELLAHNDVPVGIMNTSWGGTLIEAWTSLSALESEPLSRPIVERFKALPVPLDPASPAGKAQQVVWEREAYHQDPGISTAAAGWSADALDVSAWQFMDLPRTWESTGLDIDGAVWFRREFTVPEHVVGEDLLVRIGAIDDFDQTWCNGVAVGVTGKEVPDAHAQLRLYRFPAGIVRAGRNVIAVRVFDHFGAGGIYRGPLQVETTSGEIVERLEGEWRFRVELALEPKRTLPPSPFAIESQHYPAHLFNAMVAPLIPYAFQGLLWYQGESNNGEGMLYAEKMKALINGWRKLWNDETMPFNFVQIAPYRYNSTGLPFLWEAQLAASKIPGVGMALTTDISDIKDIHPKNKQEVGRRLALIALTRTYGVEGLVHGGPVYKSMRTEGGKARISFDGVAGGLKSRDGKELNHFTVAGADKKFVPAKAMIEGNEVVVSADGVSEITAVRFGWHELAEPNLANKEGLPAYPFRTDSWK